MPSIVLYLIKCSISLAIVWLFYQLLLRRLTFYIFNRWYLLGYTVLSFLLPLVHLVLPEEGRTPVKVIHFIPVFTTVFTGLPTAKATETLVLTSWDILLITLALGTFVFAARLLIRCLSLRRIRRGATLLQQETVAIYQVDEQIIPFSFGNAIYINPRLHSAGHRE